MADIDKSKLPKELTDKYTIAANTFVAVPKIDPKDKIEVEIGDSKQPDFKPQVKIMRWDNEVNFSVRLKDDQIEPETISANKDKIVWDKGKISANFYDIKDGEGGFEFEVILKEKPASNKIEFTLETKGLDFFYQPELTDAEVLKDWNDDLPPGETIETLRRKLRPENVVGSYAVYSSEKKVNFVGGKEYRAGKIGHIYRPKIIDNVGNEVWGELHIEMGILSVTIPQDFLDNAIYPIRHAAGLTFGYTSIGASNTAVDYTEKVWGQLVNPISAVTGDTVTSFSWYGRTDGPNDSISCALYTIVASAFSTRLGTSKTIITGTAAAGWRTSSAVSIALTNATSFGVAWDYQDSTAASFFYNYYDTTSGNKTDLSTNATFASSWTHGSFNARNYSIYATYTQSAATSIKKVSSVALASIKKISSVAIASVKKVASVA